MTDSSVPSGLSDFDFWPGEWRVRHRRLKARLAGSTEWDEFEGTSCARKILGGLGNLDDNFINLPCGAYTAATLRMFEPATGLWRIWWFDTRYPGHIDPPVVGRFEDGVGRFECEDAYEGKPIRVRFTWSRITPVSCRWEQAFSPDCGKSWETNWYMDNTRTA